MPRVTYYSPSQRKEIDLNGEGLYVQTADDLRGYKYSHNIGYRSLTGISNDARSIKLPLMVTDPAKLDELRHAMEADLYAYKTNRHTNAPGLIRVDDYSTEVLCVGSDADKITPMLKLVSLDIVLLNPYWERPHKQSFTVIPSLKNLWKQNPRGTVPIKGMTFTYKPDGSINIKGSDTSNITDYVALPDVLSPGMTYTMSCTGMTTGASAGVVISTAEGKQYYISNDDHPTVTFTVPMEFTEIEEIIQSGKGEKDITLYPVLVSGSDAKPWAPAGVIGGLDYPYDLPIDFPITGAATNINVLCPIPCDVRIIMHGKVTNPAISIGSNTYSVNKTLDNRERAIIDTQKKTVTYIDGDGNEIDIFGLGVRGGGKGSGNYCFEQLKPGFNKIGWNGEFGLEIIWYEKDTVIPWILS